MLKYIIYLVVFVNFVTAQKSAIVLLKGDEGVNGEITFTETPEGLLVDGHIKGLSPGKHGFHIHQFGDLRKGCASTGGHFNPHNQPHGAPGDKERHVGDLGNIVANDKGEAHVHIIDRLVSLSGEHCILGRAVVVHSGEDDLGKGGHPDSTTTGNAGGRVACGLVGVLHELMTQCGTVHRAVPLMLIVVTFIGSISF